MTVAVCAQCGEKKVGAFTACRRCGFEPETPKDQARAILLSDHNLSAERLEEVSETIKAGGRPGFDEAACAELSGQIREEGDSIEMPFGCAVLPWILVSLMALLALAVIMLLIVPRLRLG